MIHTVYFPEPGDQPTIERVSTLKPELRLGAEGSPIIAHHPDTAGYVTYLRALAAEAARLADQLDAA